MIHVFTLTKLDIFSENEVSPNDNFSASHGYFNNPGKIWNISSIFYSSRNCDADDKISLKKTLMSIMPLLLISLPTLKHVHVKVRPQIWQKFLMIELKFTLGFHNLIGILYKKKRICRKVIRSIIHQPLLEK